MQSVEAAAEIKNLKHCYGERTVLDLPALRLEKGLRYAVIGANGSGKSTLLRILAGVISPSEGTVDTGRQSLAFMPQKPYAFDLSVLKNVELAVRDKSRSKANAEKALKAVGLMICTAVAAAGFPVVKPSAWLWRVFWQTADSLFCWTSQRQPWIFP